VQEHKGLCSILQGASVTLHTILLGVGGTIYNNHTLEPLKSWVLILKELRNSLPSFMFILSITLPNLFIPDMPFLALLSTLIRRRFQVKPGTPLIIIDIFVLLWWRSFTVPNTKVAPFPYLKWGVIFSLRSFFPLELLLFRFCCINRWIP